MIVFVTHARHLNIWRFVFVFVLFFFCAAFVCSFILQGQTKLSATSANLIYDVRIRIIYDLWFIVAKTDNFFKIILELETFSPKSAYNKADQL